ncbi:peroxiredoxin [Fundidesulfovibrio agrisoli]|uniref:peroxiredoxin n=1 Tax=Fundidesulfovibrio agrisoli TaxID=2922717 RepID=UPI001FACBC24|nr:redoxin domain-containing protein [Fundidesulfovibrio agrisoli]
MSCETTTHSHEHSHGGCEHAHVGKPVTDFTADVFDPEEGFFGEISLEKLRTEKKWTVLFFYPADFTFVCPTELADLAVKHPGLKEAGVEVLSVSTDTKFTHMAWKGSERLLEGVRYKMVADPTGKLSRYFGVYDPDTGLALRGTFIINPDGVLVSSEVNFYNVGRNADELQRKIEANLYLIDHPAEACPAKWTPGGKTLTPSEKMVGKVYEALNG